MGGRVTDLTVKIFAAVDMHAETPYVEYASGDRYKIIRFIADRNLQSPGRYRLIIATLPVPKK